MWLCHIKVQSKRMEFMRKLCHVKIVKILCGDKIYVVLKLFVLISHALLLNYSEINSLFVAYFFWLIYDAIDTLCKDIKLEMFCEVFFDNLSQFEIE